MIMSEDWRDALAGLNLPDGGESDNDLPEEAAAPAKKLKASMLKIAVEKKGRGGKTATIIYGFPENWGEDRISDLASALKRALGTGGSARGGEILIQGNCADKIRAALPGILDKF